jgi:hypothetical protein
VRASTSRLKRDVVGYEAAAGGAMVQLEIGVQQLDAGLGEELDMDEVIARARVEHDK